MSGRWASERDGHTQLPLFPAPRRRVRAAGRPHRTRGSLFGGTRAPRRDANAFPAVASTTGCRCGTPTALRSPLPLAAGGAAPFRGRNIPLQGALRDTGALPKAFSMSPRVLAGTERCKQSAFATPSETFLPRAAFLLRACRHKHPPSLWLPGPPAAYGWPSGALGTVTQPLATFMPIHRHPRGSRRSVHSILPLAISFAGHLSLHAQRCPAGSPQYRIGAGIGEYPPGRGAPKGCSRQDGLPAAAGSTARCGYGIPTPTAPAAGAITHLPCENTSLCGRQVLNVPWTRRPLPLRSPEEEEGAGGSPCPTSQEGRRKRR